MFPTHPESFRALLEYKLEMHELNATQKCTGHAGMTALNKKAQIPSRGHNWALFLRHSSFHPLFQSFKTIVRTRQVCGVTQATYLPNIRLPPSYLLSPFPRQKRYSKSLFFRRIRSPFLYLLRLFSRYDRILLSRLSLSLSLLLLLPGRNLWQRFFRERV